VGEEGKEQDREYRCEKPEVSFHWGEDRGLVGVLQRVFSIGEGLIQGVFIGQRFQEQVSH
jgi:hypothetical protein